jgi:hypothetical protein
MTVWKKLALSGALAVSVLAGATSLAAADSRTVWGIRSGFTSDPDQFFIGMHVNMLRLWVDAPQLEFEPSAEVGFGDNDLTTIRFNGNLRYVFLVGQNQPIELYPVGGPCLIRYDQGDFGDTEFGLNIGGGFRTHGWAGELGFGVGDIPDITFTAMYTFDLH